MHRKRYQAHPTIRVEAFDGLHQADIAFLNQIGMRQAITEIATGNRNHQTQMREHQLAGGVDVAFIAQTAGKGLFFCFGQQGHAIRRLNIGFDAAAG